MLVSASSGLPTRLSTNPGHGRSGMKLEGKVAVVTGAARGIGRASAILFAKEGAKVTVADTRRELGQETVRLIQSAAGEAQFVPTDVGSEEQVKRSEEHTSELQSQSNL